MFSVIDFVISAKSWRRRSIAFLGGAVGALALPPFDFFPAFFVPMTLSVWLLDGSVGKTLSSSLWRAAGAGWWLGFGYFLFGLWWVGAAFLAEADQFAWALPLGVVGLPCLLALFTAAGFVLACGLWSSGKSRIFVLAGALSVAELLRGAILTGFPWNNFGMVLGGNLILAQSASIWGLYGLTILSILIFSAPALVFDKGSKIVPLSLCVVFMGLGLFGFLRLSAPSSDVAGTRLRIIQPNIAVEDFRSDRKDQLLDHYLALSELRTTPNAVADGGTHFLFWPESAFPFILARDREALLLLGSRLRDVVLFTGAARETGEGRSAQYFNSIQVVVGGEIKESYDKRHLVPFGEYLPLAGLMRRLGLKQFVEIPGGFNPGRAERLLSAPGIAAVVPMICYESIFPYEIAKRITSRPSRPGFLLNVTNDGWFGNTAGPYQHFAQARLRAIEQGLPMVRAANTGISAIVDPLGRTVARAPLGVEAVIDGALPAALPPTWFSEHPVVSLIFLWAFVFAGSFVHPRRI
jgi:apolipoprotein N-acyltransferase